MYQVVSRIIEMGGYGRRSQSGGIGQHLLDTIDFTDIIAWRIAEVHVNKATIKSAQLLQFEYFAGRYSFSHVSKGRADSKSSLL